MAFTKATKAKAKARIALYGPSGSGKTFSALRIATGLGGKIGFIDTERGSASKYADRFGFDVDELQDRTIDGYCHAFKEAASVGIDVLIVDSLTHAWEELLQDVERIAKAKYKGNTWSAWNEGTPKQRQLVNAILDFPGHILVTMRSRTEWENEKDERTGKSKPVRVGLAPQQGKGIEYEFDILLEINQDHFGTVVKDRSGKFQDKTIEKPGEDFGKELAAWLSDGVERQPLTPTEHSKFIRTEHGQAAKAATTGTGHGGFDSAMALMPKMVAIVGTRDALDPWLTIVKDLVNHPASMPLSAAAVEKRDNIVKAVNCLYDILLSGCLSASDGGSLGELALRSDYAAACAKANIGAEVGA